MVFALAFDSTMTRGFATIPTDFLLAWVVLADDPRGVVASVNERSSLLAGDRRSTHRAAEWCHEQRGAVNSWRAQTGFDGPSILRGRAHVCWNVALGPDPKQILSDFGGAATIILILIIFAETGLLIGFFLPGDSLLFTAGLLASQSKPGQAHLNLWVVLIGCFLAAVIGDQVGFTIGERAGPRIFSRPESRLFKQEFVERTEVFFEKHGPKTIVIARFVPIVRTFAPVLAGVGNMTRRTFLMFNVLGAFLWVAGVTMAGYLLADAIGDSIDTYLLPIIAVIIVLSLIPPFLEWRKAKREDTVKPKSAADAEAEAAQLRSALEED